MRARNSDPFGALVASLGANLVLISLAQQATNARILSFPFGTFPIEIFKFASLRISLLQITMVASLAVLVGGLCYYLFVMPFGRQVRAVAVSERTPSTRCSS
jgi:branched-chain amino acid transport system permease protein